MSDGAGRPGAGARLALTAAFVASGASALVYEVAWSRMLVVVVGNTPLVHTIAVAAFLIGLGLGALWGGLLTRRFARPLLAVALVELAICVIAWAVPMVVPVAGAACRMLADPERGRHVVLAAQATISGVAMALPAVLMGASLPLLVAAFTRGVTDVKVTRDLAAITTGRLYGWNTAGAVLGVLAAGFVLVPELGARGATLVATMGNLAMAVLAWWIERGLPARAVPADVVETPPGEVDTAAAARMNRAVALVAVSAIASIALQLVWTRWLALHLRGVTYTFTAVLAVTIASLALGDLVATRWVSRRGSHRAMGALGVTLALAGMMAVCVPVASPIVQQLRQLVEVAIPVRGTTSYACGLVALAAALVGLPALLFGAVLPLAAATALAGRQGTSAATGAARLLMASSIGGAVGAVLGGLVLVPTLGTLRALAVPGLVAVFAGTLAAIAGGGMRTRAVALLALVAAAGLASTLDSSRPILEDTAVFRARHAWGRTVIEDGVREGLACVVTVLDDHGTGDRMLFTDEFAATSTASTAAYMRMLGHLPLLAAAREELALVICYGTGTTAGSVAAHDEVQRIDIVEISREVLEVSPHFVDSNRGVLGDPRVRAHIADGRAYLAGSRMRWDVISLEPLLPTTPQAVHFYTLEFYLDARTHLREGGVLCQWLPVHAMTLHELEALIGTFAVAFPGECSLWFFEESFALLGGEGALVEPRQLLDRGFRRSSQVTADLRAAGIVSAAHLAGSCVLGAGALAEIAGRRPAVTDDRPWVEFYEHRAALERLLQPAEALEAIVAMGEAAGSSPLAASLGDPDTRSRVEARWRSGLLGMHARALAARAFAAGRAGPGSRDLAMDLARGAIEMFDLALDMGGDPPDPVLISRRDRAAADLLALEAARALASDDPVAAAASLARAVERRPDDPELVLGLARCQRRAGQVVGARETLDALLARWPGHPLARLERARLALDLGDRALAESDVAAALAARRRDREVERLAREILGE